MKIRGALRTPAVTEVPDTELKVDKKSKHRLAIQEQVFDNADSIADNAKIASLLLTVISRIYDIIPSSQKDNLDQNDRDMIEYTFNKFANTNTRADIQFATEGLALVDRLLDRQAAICAITGGN